MKSIMKYLVIGAGGTGGCIGANMTEAGYDVTLIARGEHLRLMKENGLVVTSADRGTYTVPVKAEDMDHYNESPDIIFVCVKGYSLEDTIPFIKRVAHKDTVVIPILNIYGTGGRMQEKLPELLVTDGCIYIAAQISEPGKIAMNGAIFRVVFGVREASEYREVLATVKADLEKSKITPILSDNIQRDALQKFSYVSPAAACGQYYDANADVMQVPGEIRDTFIALVKEVDDLAKAMGLDFGMDIVKNNLDILDSLAPDASTSMQRDIRAGKASEIDGLIHEVVRMGDKYGIDLPTYRMISENLKKKGL